MTHLGRVGRLAAAILAISSLALASGCTDDGDDGDEVTAPDLARDTSTASTQATGKPADAQCQIEGFVSSRPITVTRGSTVLAYVAVTTLPPTAQGSGMETLMLATNRPAAWASTGSGVPAPEVLSAVRRSVGDVHTLSDEVTVRVRIDNNSNVNKGYVVYRTVDVLTGTWKDATCGGTSNDGTVVTRTHGRFRALQGLSKVKVHDCGDEPVGPSTVRKALKQHCL